MSTTRLLKEQLLPHAKKMGYGAASSALVSNIISAESKEIQFRAIKLAAMLAVGNLIINGVKSSINAEAVCKSLCTSLKITQNHRDIFAYAKQLFSGDTSRQNLDAMVRSAERLGGKSLPPRQKEGARYLLGGATLTLRLLSFLAQDTASLVLGYSILHGIGLNYYAKELGASFTQTFFTTILTASAEFVGEQVSFRMRK